MSSAHIRRDGDDRAGGVAGAHAAHDVPAGQQSVAERAAEGVARAEPAHDLDRIRRNLLAHSVGGGDEHAVAAHLHDRRRETPRQQLLGGAVRVALADRHLALGAVTDRHRHVIEHLVELGGGVGRRAPELGAPVEVEHGVGAPRSPGEQVVDRRATGLCRQARGREPEDRHRLDDLAVDVGALDRHVGRLRRAVEDDHGLARVLHRGEGERCRQRRVGADESRVDAERARRAPSARTPPSGRRRAA